MYGPRVDDRATRAKSFGSVAGEYERARPGYPDEAVLWLVGAGPCRVLDLGAGAGKRTRQLLGLVWNMRDAALPCDARLSELIGTEGWSREYDPIEPLRASGRFTDAEETTFRLEQRLDRSALRDLIASRSHLAMREAAERERVL